MFLHYYESRWIRQLRKSDIKCATRFAHVFRFIDDLTAINDGEEFEKSCKEIYPPELELKKENVGYSEGSFLNFRGKIEKN